jgi:hypothetical protein
MRLALWLLAGAIGISYPALLLGQVAAADLPAVSAPSNRLVQYVDTEQQQSASKAVGFGVLLGGVGFLAGGAVGYAIASSCQAGTPNPDDWCAVEGTLIGAAIGGTSGMALGVHLGNGRRGSLALDLLTGAAVWGLGIGIAAGAKPDWGSPLFWTLSLGIPVGQLAATVAVERAVGRSRGGR